ncbi:hypothetical protein C1646_771868 [Rhizophagus diaphanus]|nr:hypothetical protein C1646_771868 [Rhizophagus diaphanus] [Rhizophagus sp. MUCL 43196]
MSNKIDKHHLLNEIQKQRLTSLIENDHMVEMYWESRQQNEAIAFLNQHSLLPEQIKSGLTNYISSHKDTKETGYIVRVMGYLEHLEAYKRAIRIALPIFNLHFLVKEIALDLLKKCNEKVIIGNNRLLLKASDITNIMRNFRKTYLNINTRMEIRNRHLTKNQRKLAWSFGHEDILLLDGTFDICNCKILLFILMILNQQRQGIPIAYFIFSPSFQNKCTSSGYDHKILEIFFQKFVILTDTDLKKRKALEFIWPNALMLLCLFYVHQSWKNKLNELLDSKGTSQIINLKKQIK